MKRIIYFLIPLFFASCGSMKDAQIENDIALIQNDSLELPQTAMKIENHDQGIIYDSASDISRWDISHRNISFQKKEGSLMFNLLDAGMDWEYASLKFNAIDFSNAQNLNIRMKNEGKEKSKIRIDLYDENGNFTNFVPQEKTIDNNNEFNNYIFIFKDNWIQNWPFKANVDKTKIVEIRINFNGGGPNYSGRIFIEQIKAIP